MNYLFSTYRQYNTSKKLYKFRKTSYITHMDLEKRYDLASRKRRIVAFIIDHFIMSFLIVLLTFLFLGADFMNATNFDEVLNNSLYIFLFSFILYSAKDSVKGISIGKWVMGIMVVDDKSPNDTPSLARLFIRNLFIFIWPVEFIILASSNEKKRLGDTIAKTIVVQNPNKLAKLPRISAIAATIIIFFFSIFILVSSIIKSTDAYKVAISEIEQNQEIIAITGGIKGFGMMPTGSINITNGNGQAALQIKVLGNEKNINLTAYLSKRPNGDWKLTQLNQQN
ncbi:RDD family protein [uncultured Kordia sp.]|uniref:RDD family protein n=1 Tax=uncultured Kordia sp. TaxID=507699 RepID=UPI0026176439|nr:RDD family protein [uncultured Kordia sp.]